MLPVLAFLLISGASQAITPQINLGTNFAQQLHRPRLNVVPRFDQSNQDSTCYTVRSYRFHRQDGQAPVLAGVTTCTPGNTLRQKQVSPRPAQLAPLNFGADGK